ncbi:MAG: hypothetical protein LBG11_04395, partial [Bifidobacteriaceae bacterium]|nr:hypothetical protein [Bifidobacteriaceae bacterium]
MLFLSMDVGTSAVKASIVDSKLQELATSTVGYPYLMLPGSKVEISPAALWDGIGRAARQLDEDLRSRVEAVVYDAFSPSPVFLTAGGELAYPNVITHMDRRSAAQSAYVSEVIGSEAFQRITGMAPFIGGSGLMSLLWLRQNEPGCLRRTAQVTHLAGYLHRRLTGVSVTDFVNASMLGTYETTTQRGWSRRLIDALELKHEWFGEIQLPGELSGQLTDPAAAKLGLRAGIAVTVGTNDMAAAQVGAGNTAPGSIMNTAGSSDMVSILTDVPKIDPKYYLRNSALPGIWQIYATTAGGFALDWFHRQFARDLGDEEFFGSFLEAAAQQPEGESLVEFTPYLTGDRQSLLPKSASCTGLTLAATREQVLAAMLKAMAGVLAETIDLAAASVELRREIKISGGLATPALIGFKARC